jgi:hypothetical protein
MLKLFGPQGGLKKDEVQSLGGGAARKLLSGVSRVLAVDLHQGP